MTSEPTCDKEATAPLSADGLETAQPSCGTCKHYNGKGQCALALKLNRALLGEVTRIGYNVTPDRKRCRFEGVWGTQQSRYERR